MDTSLLTSIAVQFPLVIFFAWFVLKRDREWQIFMEKVATQLAKNTVCVLLHDATVRGENADPVGCHEDLLNRVLETNVTT